MFIIADPKENNILIPNLILIFFLVDLSSLILSFVCYKAWN
jgi:hypothetical protein